MKKVVLLFVALLIVVGFSTSPAQAQFCLDFDVYCDGLEISVAGSDLSGFWRNTDCLGTDVSVLGVVRSGLPSPCGGVTNAGIACDAGVNGCEVSGESWIFMIDALDGTMDMGQGFPPNVSQCWIDEMAYNIIMGPCPFQPDKGLRPQMSTTH